MKDSNKKTFTHLRSLLAEIPKPPPLILKVPQLTIEYMQDRVGCCNSYAIYVACESNIDVALGDLTMLSALGKLYKPLCCQEMPR